MWLSGMMRLVNFHLGASLYVMAKVAVDGSFEGIFILLGGCALLTLLVYENLADVAVAVNQRQVPVKASLCGLVSQTLGPRVAVLLRMLVVLNAFGVFVSYGKTIMDVYDAVLQEGASAAAQGVGAICVGCVGVLIFCGSQIDGWDSLLANGTLLFLLVALFFLEPVPAPASVAKPWGELIESYGPSLVFAFSSAEYVLFACGVVNESGDFLRGVPVHRRVRIIGSSSVLISYILYLAVGYGGAKAFGSGVEEDILKNFALKESKHEFLSATVLATNGASLLLSLPVFTETFLQYIRELLEDLLPARLFQQASESSGFVHLVNPRRPWLGMAWVLPVDLIAAHRASSLIDVINLMSSCTDYAFMFVFPSLAFCAAVPWSKRPIRWTMNVLLAVLACCLGSKPFYNELVPTDMVLSPGSGANL